MASVYQTIQTLAEAQLKQARSTHRRASSKYTKHALAQTGLAAWNQRDGVEHTEELFCAPRKVRSTDAVSVGSVVVDSTENPLCGGNDMLRFFQEVLLNIFTIIVLLFSADRASGNTRFFKIVLCARQVLGK